MIPSIAILCHRTLDGYSILDKMELYGGSDTNETKA